MMTEGQARDILGMIGVLGPAQVTPIKENHHVFEIGSRQGTFFLKTYTKGWYGGDAGGTGYCVGHERDAWVVLARHGLAVPEVALAAQDTANPLGRPFLMTRGLRGEPLTTLLARADGEESGRLLGAVGDYLRRMHAVTFAYPGYVTGAGPEAPPEEGEWQHRSWTAQARRKAALAMLDRRART